MGSSTRRLAWGIILSVVSVRAGTAQAPASKATSSPVGSRRRRGKGIGTPLPGQMAQKRRAIRYPQAAPVLLNWALKGALYMLFSYHTTEKRGSYRPSLGD